ncbi:MAG TPA: BlaI/MecI/CopY family transcriptional regulator [Candidatus Hydrogenedentes bacterium]|nr:BlaI/MecI/CopY family transcriptional regulator [Candidatus Hydrogenedentota bacterium]HQM47199.1 BlaI/MecI/CopY family transcriptional regulator [Candidatus Hydrogenedentota bacterium]
MTNKRQRPTESARKALENLPGAELEVMACLWQKGEATARHIREEMAPYRPMTHGALVTLLKRLEAKGLVSKRKGNFGKAFVFRAVHTPEPVYRKIMRDLHERVFGGSGAAMFASLFETRPPSVEEVDELQKLLDDLRRQQTRARKG